MVFESEKKEEERELYLTRGLQSISMTCSDAHCLQASRNQEQLFILHSSAGKRRKMTKSHHLTLRTDSVYSVFQMSLHSIDKSEACLFNLFVYLSLVQSDKTISVIVKTSFVLIRFCLLTIILSTASTFSSILLKI